MQLRDPWSTLRVVVKSSGVGFLATLTDLTALALLVHVLAVPVRLASVPALCMGVAVQFIGNKLFAFDDRSAAWVRQGAQFLMVESLGFVANLVLFDLAMTHTHLPYLPVRLLTTSIVYFAICLPLWSRIFKTGARGEEES